MLKSADKATKDPGVRIMSNHEVLDNAGPSISGAVGGARAAAVFTALSNLGNAPVSKNVLRNAGHGALAGSIAVPLAHSAASAYYNRRGLNSKTAADLTAHVRVVDSVNTPIDFGSFANEFVSIFEKGAMSLSEVGKLAPGMIKKTQPIVTPAAHVQQELAGAKSILKKAFDQRKEAAFGGLGGVGMGRAGVNLSIGGASRARALASKAMPAAAAKAVAPEAATAARRALPAHPTSSVPPGLFGAHAMPAQAAMSM